MKKSYLFLLPAVAAVVFFAAFAREAKNSHGFITGTPEVKSMSALAFGPDGVLFIGDSKSATIFAVNTKDSKMEKVTAVDIKNIDQKIAAALGAEAASIRVLDMAVNPMSKKIYFAVQPAVGMPVLLRLNGEKLEAVPMTDISYAATALNDAPGEEAKDNRGRPLRVSTISDIGYADGKLLVSGISNKEFASALRSISYPFNDKQDYASLEMYHGAHGRFETASPIRTFTTSTIDGKKYLIASYTCTPLVLYPMEDLRQGMHVKGRTVSEMGSGNTPIDMLTIKKGGENYLIMANTARPVSKVDYKNIAAYQGTITEQVEGTAGVAYTNLSMSNVLQMDKLDDANVLILQKMPTGEINLWTAGAQQL